MSATSNSGTSAAAGVLEELGAAWRQWPDKPLFFALLMVWFALFHFLGNSTFGYTDTNSLIQWLYKAYNSEGSDDGHGNLIPFVVLVLFWLKRDKLLTVEKSVWWPALSLVVMALGLHILGYLVQQPRLSVMALFLGIYGMMGLVWGWSFLRASFFPFCLFVFCVPVGSMAGGITFPLRILVAKISVGVAHHLLAIDVIRDGSRIMDANQKYFYDVAPACSGIRSLVSLLALTTVYGFVTFRPNWKRALIVLLSLPLAILGNVVRLLVVIIWANSNGQEAGKRIEQNLGFVTFAIALGCILLLGHLLRDRATEPSDALEARGA